MTTGHRSGTRRRTWRSIATRQALNRLRTQSRRREDYVGPWLPEPLVTAPDIADDVVLAESVSMAMMLVVESLTPDERAVFVLHEVFGFAHDEIADAIGKSTGRPFGRSRIGPGRTCRPGGPDSPGMTPLPPKRCRSSWPRRRRVTCRP